MRLSLAQHLSAQSTAWHDPVHARAGRRDLHRVYNLWASFDKIIEDIQGYFLADINISFDHGYRFDKVATIAESIPGVASVEGWLEYPGTLNIGR